MCSSEAVGAGQRGLALHDLVRRGPLVLHAEAEGVRDRAEDRRLPNGVG